MTEDKESPIYWYRQVKDREEQEFQLAKAFATHFFGEPAKFFDLRVDRSRLFVGPAHYLAFDVSAQACDEWRVRLKSHQSYSSSAPIYTDEVGEWRFASGPTGLLFCDDPLVNAHHARIEIAQKLGQYLAKIGL